MASVAFTDEDQAPDLAPLLSLALWCPTPCGEAVRRVLTKWLPPCFWIAACRIVKGHRFLGPKLWRSGVAAETLSLSHLYFCHSFSHLWEPHVQTERAGE